MKIGPHEILQMDKEVMKANFFASTMTPEEAFSRLVVEKPELVEAYRAHGDAPGPILNPWCWRVFHKWYQIFRDSENTDPMTQESLNKLSDLLKVPRVLKTVGVSNR
jgi:hypothetical protein